LIGGNESASHGSWVGAPASHTAMHLPAIARGGVQAAWLKLCGDADPQKAKRENEFALRAIFGTSLSTVALVATKVGLALGLGHNVTTPPPIPSALMFCDPYYYWS
jgi:hypothetical protein